MLLEKGGGGYKDELVSVFWKTFRNLGFKSFWPFYRKSSMSVLDDRDWTFLPVICSKLKVQRAWWGNQPEAMSGLCELSLRDISVAGGAGVFEGGAPTLHPVPLPCGRCLIHSKPRYLMGPGAPRSQTGRWVPPLPLKLTCSSVAWSTINFLSSLALDVSGCLRWQGETSTGAFTDASDRICCHE